MTKLPYIRTEIEIVINYIRKFELRSVTDIQIWRDVLKYKAGGTIIIAYNHNTHFLYSPYANLSKSLRLSFQFFFNDPTFQSLVSTNNGWRIICMRVQLSFILCFDTRNVSYLIVEGEPQNQLGFWRKLQNRNLEAGAGYTLDYMFAWFFLTLSTATDDLDVLTN